MPLYKVFAKKSDLGDFGVAVEQSYPAFQIISASEGEAEALRQKFPVQHLPDSSVSFVPEAFASLAEANDSRRGRRDWIITFRYPVKQEWIKELEEMGLVVLGSAGKSAVIAAVPNVSTLGKVKRHEYVASVHPHRAIIDIDPTFLVTDGRGTPQPESLPAAAEMRDSLRLDAPSPRNLALPGALHLDFYTAEDAQAALRRLKRAKVRNVVAAGPTRLSVDLSHSEDLQRDMLVLFKCPGMRRVEQHKFKSLFNDKAREVIGGSVVTGNPVQGLSGSGEIIGVADSGIDDGNAQTVHADFRGRVVDIESWPIVPGLASYVNNPGADDGASDDFSGHGTHVAGSVLGNGSRSAALGIGRIRGMAPEAELLFQAIEQRPQWTDEMVLYFLSRGQTPPVSGLYGIPDDLTDLFDSAYQKGARIHNNSWGGGSPGEYDNQCMDLDRFVWEHKDMLIVVAAGNSGSDQTSPAGSIDPMSVDSPGTAKNCITVGACENNRNGEFIDQYGQWWPNDFPNPNIVSDPMVDSVDDIVAFSSRGPCATGRRKPDVVAPGTFILSTRSSRIPPNHFSWGAFTPAKKDYMFMGGTSMASPLVAGSAALLRQHLRTNKNIENPSAALLKAGLIHSAQYLNYRYRSPDSMPFADNEQGWGRIDLEKVIELGDQDGPIFHDHHAGLSTGEACSFRLRLAEPGSIHVTMAYTDAPGRELVNNLNLLLFGPSGEILIGNDFQNTGYFDELNNIEVIRIEANSGDWIIRLVGSEVVEGTQDFAMIVSAPAGADLSEDS